MIRLVGAGEWQAWRELRLRALADTPDAFAQTLAEATTHDEARWRRSTELRPQRVCLFGERDGVPAGMAVVAIDDPSHASLYAMWVAPEARRAGLGRSLVVAAIGWARQHAVRELALEVSVGAGAARRMYEEVGFIDTGERTALRTGSDIIAHTLVARLAPLVMGVVNVTPDSFSDGGRYFEADDAVAHGLQLLRDGADILDVGGAASNPRARPVAPDEELRRVLPVIERLAAAGARIAVDTTSAVVARAAVAAGASIVNDVSGGLFDPEMARSLADLDVTYIAGHLRGRSLAEVFAAEAPVGWRIVADELVARVAALPPGVAARTWVDPGIGFGKGADPEGNLDLLRHAGEIAAAVGCPIVVGPSRKRFLRKVVGAHELDTDGLDAASVLAALGAVHAGANVVRAHNVALLRTALSVYTKD